MGKIPTKPRPLTDFETAVAPHIEFEIAKLDDVIAALVEAREYLNRSAAAKVPR